MDYGFDICFNQEFPSILEFEEWINALLCQHGLQEKYTADDIGFYIAEDCQVFQAVSEYPEVKIAVLKTTCLEIIDVLAQNCDADKKANRRQFDQAIQALFNGKDRDARIFCASISRQLRQFRLGKTYDAKEIIAEAYTRGVKRIEAGKTIDNPLAWLRGACLNVIREFKREQIDSGKPKFDKRPWVPGDAAFCALMLQEDFLAIRRAVEELSPEERELLSKRIDEGLTWKAIAETSPSPLKEGTVRQRGARMMGKLKDRYPEIREDIQWPDNQPVSDADQR